MRSLLATSAVPLMRSAALVRAGVCIPVEPPLVVEKDLNAFLTVQLGFIRGSGPLAFNNTIWIK